MKEREERLELVTDFAALRAGMIVAVKHCVCGATVREMLVKRFRDPTWGMVWSTLPAHGHFGIDETYLCDDAVYSGRLYRVVDGLDPEADRHAEVIFSTAAQLRKEKVRR